MNNEIQRKITSLTLMTIMLAGGMTIAAPGFMPTASAAEGDELFVSASEVGNFAGIQVIEIVVNDPDRSDTSESQGIPNVEINGDDVLMAQANDGSWYAYVANELKTLPFDRISEVYGSDPDTDDLSGSDAITKFYAATEFLDGYKDLSGTDGSAATGLITIETTSPLFHVAEIGAFEYIGVKGPAYNDNHFEIAEDNWNADALSLANAINATSIKFTAKAFSNTVIVSTIAVGAGSNIETFNANSAADLSATELFDGEDITDATDTVFLTATVVGATHSSTLVTVGPVLAGDNVAIDGLIYIAVDSPTPNYGLREFSMLGGDSTVIATSLETAINTGSLRVNATSSTNIVTVYATESGLNGNSIPIGPSSDLATLDIDGAVSLLGAVPITEQITLNGLDYVPITHAPFVDGEFTVVGNADVDGAAFALAVTDDTRTGTLGDVISDNNGGGSVDVTSTLIGSAGNTVELIVVGANISTNFNTGYLVGSDATSATGTFNIDGDISSPYVEIDDIYYYGLDGDEGDDSEFNFSDIDESDTASSLVSAINARQSNTVYATSDVAAISITAANGGSEGSSITISSSTGITQSAANLVGGSSTLDNNPSLTSADWPLIQTFAISGNTDVTISYGTGTTAETVTLLNDYDDTKNISLDRNKFPLGGQVFIDLDDSLLNLSPIADDYWSFDSLGNVDYYVGDLIIDNIDFSGLSGVGFEKGPFIFDNDSTVYDLQNTEIRSDFNEETAEAVIFRESSTNDNIFVNYDRADKSNLIVTGSGQSSVSYNGAESILLETFDGAIKFLSTVDEWYSGVELDLQVVDEDRNLNTRSNEIMSLLEEEVPYLEIGDPITIDDVQVYDQDDNLLTLTAGFLTDSKTGQLVIPDTVSALTVNATWPSNYAQHIDHPHIFPYLNLDFSKLGGPIGTFYTGNSTGDGVGNDITNAGITVGSDEDRASFTFNVNAGTGQVYFDLFFFGQVGDIVNSAAVPYTGDIESNVDRVNDAIYRFELEETDDNTATFIGTVEYIMINQLNVFDVDTYGKIVTRGDEIVIIVNDDSDGTDAIGISYNDIRATSNEETISVKEDANTHSGIITVDKLSYSSGNTVTVTLEDSDLNTDSETIQSYIVESSRDWIGNDDVWLVQMLIGNVIYNDSCGATLNSNLGLDDTGITFIETSVQSGVFEGTLQLPSEYCIDSTTKSSTNGVDIDFEYQDYSDASGKPNEASNGASITSNTGSVSFDRTVYPVPFDADDFPTHDNSGYLPTGDVNIVIRVDDQDSNLSASGEDTLDIGTLKMNISSGSKDQPIDLGTVDLVETDPESGIFEIEVLIEQKSYAVLGSLINQGDIITVTYEDPDDASGSANTVTDSATFDLRNGVLQSDKSVYLIGSNAIITLIEPDLNLDSESAETWSLDLVNWDSDAGDVNLSGLSGDEDLGDIFDAQPSGFRETGDNTGIFQVVIEIPKEIDGDRLERGEQIDLEYQDQGPAGADYVGDDEEDIELTIFTSNFGATVELDQKVYTWTDKVYITVVAPDHNFDSDRIDEIGTDSDNQIDVTTRSAEIEEYKLVETGSDTGIFTGEIILVGFSSHDADGDGIGLDADGITTGTGPTGGRIASSSDDGLTISFEYSDGEFASGSALIRWNVGEVQWLEASYPASGTGVMRVIDPDMNLNPESVDNFDVNVWSDTSAGGISLRVTETNEATGIFEGTVAFTTTAASSGSRLAVAEGDTVTAEYEDNTLPDPYSTADELDITATTLIGTLVPPLERAPAANLRAVDAFNNSLDTVSIDQQVQVTADLSNGQDRDQEFAYLLQVQNEEGVTVSLSWITGELQAGQSFSPAVSWIPAGVGNFEATAFVWQSVDNPTALSPPVSTSIIVN